MEDLGYIISSVWHLFNLPISLYGYTFTWFHVFAFSFIVGIVGVAVDKLMD